KVSELQQRLSEARADVSASEARLKQQNEKHRLCSEARARAEQKVVDSEVLLKERSDARQAGIAQLQAFAASGLWSIALPELQIPGTSASWSIETALTLARRTEQALGAVKDDDETWTRLQ